MYKGDVEDLCGLSDGRKKKNLLEGDFSLVEVPSQGTDSLNFSLEQVHPHPHLYYVYCIHPSHQEVEIDGETWCLEQESRNIQLDKSPNASSWKVNCHDEKIIELTSCRLWSCLCQCVWVLRLSIPFMHHASRFIFSILF